MEPITSGVKPKTRHRGRWWIVVSVSVVAVVGYAVWLDRTIAPECAGHGRPLVWIWPVAGLATAVTVGLSARSGERAAVVATRAVVTLILTTGGLLLVVLVVAARHGCWS
jgi:hypothetical protein